MVFFVQKPEIAFAPVARIKPLRRQPSISSSVTSVSRAEAELSNMTSELDNLQVLDTCRAPALIVR